MPSFADRYNTELNSGEQAKFNNWVMRERSMTGKDPLVDKYDYDIQGWWKENQGKDLSGGHLTDEFKKPNHPTFSDESKYNGVDGYKGGTWGGKDGEWTFTPGPTNLQLHPPEELQDYFSKVEPDTKLLMPETPQ